MSIRKTFLEMYSANKGRIILTIALIIGWAFLLWMFKSYGYNKTWELWGVQTEPMVFMDFRLIPGSAESFRHGYEPSIENPFEPGGRLFNYPAIWRLFFQTGITQDDTVWIVVLMLILFFTGIILFPRKLSVTGAFWMLLVIFSPACMLLYERGNVDLIMFFICVLAILAVENSASLAVGVILFGSVVKLFPFFGLTMLLKETKKKFVLWIVVSAVVMFVYSWLTFENEKVVWSTTMRGHQASYGAFVLLTRFGSCLQWSFTQCSVLLEVLALVFIFGGAILALRNAHSSSALDDWNLSAFRMGASIYIGTFLLGNSWDYRLAFLILVIPQLSQWFYSEKKEKRYIAFGVMGAVLLSCWHFVLLIDLPFIPFQNELDRIVVFDEIVNWLLLPGFAYLLVASSPDWLREDLQRVFGMKKAVG